MLKAGQWTSKQLFWRILMAACAASALGLLLDDFPFIGAIILSPLFLIRSILFGGLCTIAWTIAIVLRVATVANEGDHFWTTFHVALNAAIIGLAPHALFLIMLNHSPVWFSGSTMIVAVSWYESSVQWLQDRIGPYLILPFSVGVAVTIFIFMLEAKEPTVAAGMWLTRSLSAARFCGLILIAATSFTVFSAAPAEGWQPNSRRVFEAKWNEHVTASAELAVIQTVISQFANPTSTLPSDLSFVAASVHGLADESKRAAGRGCYEEVKPTWESNYSDFPDRSPQRPDGIVVPREAIQTLENANNALMQKTAAARALLSSLVGTTFGYAAEQFVGAFLSAFVEDAATRISADTLAKSSTADTLATRISHTQASLSALRAETLAATLPMVAAITQRLRSREAVVNTVARVMNRIVQEKQAERMEAYRRRYRARGR